MFALTSVDHRRSIAFNLRGAGEPPRPVIGVRTPVARRALSAREGMAIGRPRAERWL